MENIKKAHIPVIWSYYQFLLSKRYFILGFNFFLSILASATPSLAQISPTKPVLSDRLLLAQALDRNLRNRQIAVPPSQGQTISEIKVRFVDRNNQPVTGKSKPDVIIREFDLKAGDIYNAELAKTGLRGVNNLITIKRGNLSLEEASTSNDTVMVVTVEERNRFLFEFASTLAQPSALKGPARPVIVLPQSNRTNGISGGVRFGARNLGGDNRLISLGAEAGEKTLGLDLDYRNWWRANRGYGVNFYNRQGRETEFSDGEIEVNLPNGDDIWVDRLGGGLEFFFPLAQENFQGAVGINYQKVSTRDGLFSSTIEPVDELGDPLTFSGDGQDSLLSIDFASALDKRNSSLNPTQGYRLLLGMNQSIPIGDASILYNRLTANGSYFLPLNLFGFTEGDRTLALNLQGGTIIGDVPPYEGFNIGGSGSLRGFSGGEAGTGRSFVHATAEYRFPIFKFNAFKDEYSVAGSLFVDYASTLGSQDAVKGKPGEVRGKPGSGWSYGLGLRAPTRFGTFRLEFALNDNGDSRLNFNIGENF
ncbi:MAG: BamA/TamA family outer membrane protein [Waterburya sp.]